jgi:putative transposase
MTWRRSSRGSARGSRDCCEAVGSRPRTRRRGRRVWRVGDEADAEGVISRRPRQAHLDGFDLHANVWVGANDRAGLERLCRYILRPPFAQERLRLRGDGRVGLELKRAWHDGTRELVFEPLEFLERLSALTPRPETNLLLCHGVLAARARWREQVVAYGRVEREPTASAVPMVRGPGGPGRRVQRAAGRGRR